MKDWIGDGHFLQGGNKRKEAYDANLDYYATHPKATEVLLEHETFSPYIWEPACGEGHISKVLLAHGYSVKSTDIVARGYEQAVVDFFSVDELDKEYDIITNPPYKYALEFCQHGLDLLHEGRKMAMFLKLTFLEGQKRKSFFLSTPPVKVLVFSSRVQCGKNGDFKPENSAVAYAWFIWEKGWKGDTQIRWVN